MKASIHFGLILLATLLVLSGLPRAAGAQEAAETPPALAIDASAFPQVTVLITSAVGPPGTMGIIVTEDGRPAEDLELERREVGVRVAVLLDLSWRGMSGQGQLEASRAAIGRLALDLEPETDRFALYGYNSKLTTLWPLDWVNGNGVQDWLAGRSAEANPLKLPVPEVGELGRADGGVYGPEDIGARTDLEGALRQALDDLDQPGPWPATQHRAIVIFGGTCHDTDDRTIKASDLNCELSTKLKARIAQSASVAPLTILGVFVGGGPGARREMLDTLASTPPAGRADVQAFTLVPGAQDSPAQKLAFSEAITEEIARRRVQLAADFTANQGRDAPLRREVAVTFPSNPAAITSTAAYTAGLQSPVFTLEIEREDGSPPMLVVKVEYSQTPLAEVSFKDATGATIQTLDQEPFRIPLEDHDEHRRIEVTAIDQRGASDSALIDLPPPREVPAQSALAWWLLVALSLLALGLGVAYWLTRRALEHWRARPRVHQAQQTPAGFFLVRRTGGAGDEEYALRAGKTRLGSSEEAEISLPDKRLAPCHAVITLSEGKLLVRGNPENDPVFVNNKQLLADTELELKVYDLLTLGAGVVVLQCFSGRLEHSQ